MSPAHGAGRVLLSVVTIYVLVCAGVFLIQRRLMYFPDRTTEADAVRRAAALGLAAWRDGGGGLLGWRAPLSGDASTARILVLHGNAGSALDRVYYLQALGGPGRELVFLEYPGYGARPGRPSQTALTEAAAAALAHLRAERPGPVWLLGESIGSAVAAQVAGRDPSGPAGLLLVTPMARVSEVASAAYPYLPVRLLLLDRWDSVAALQAWRGPTAVVIAGQDEVVGAAQGRRLAAALTPAPFVHEQAAAGHNSLDAGPESPPWPELRALVDRSLAAKR